jgi:Fe-S-cluster containining protein
MPSLEPASCALCHASGRGCCRLAARGPENVFGLTQAEIKAMAKASGLAANQFTVSDQASPELIAQAEALHPALARTLNHGARLRLKVDSHGICCFLKPDGCSLPRRARPIFCRMYPVFVAPQGELVLIFKEDCLAQEGAASPEEVLKRLGQTEKSLRNLHARLLRLSAAHLTQ